MKAWKELKETEGLWARFNTVPGSTFHLNPPQVLEGSKQMNLEKP